MTRGFDCAIHSYPAAVEAPAAVLSTVMLLLLLQRVRCRPAPTSAWLPELPVRWLLLLLLLRP